MGRPHETKNKVCLGLLKDNSTQRKHSPYAIGAPFHGNPALGIPPLVAELPPSFVALSIAAKGINRLFRDRTHFV